MNFKEKVFEIVRNIPRGEVLTYKDVAKKAGSPKAFRAAGNVLNKNKDPNVPCHRIIRSDGRVGGYSRGKREKIKLLEKEGLFITKDKVYFFKKV